MKGLAVATAVGLVASACASSGGTPAGDGGGTTPAGNGGSTAPADNDASQDFGAGKTITIPDIGWAEDVAATNLWKAIWESEGFTVKTSTLPAGQIFQGLADGDLNVFFDTWLPKTHKKYWEKYGDKMEKINVWYDHASLHLTVPAYVKDVNSIADLKSHASEFDGKITGIEPGAGEMGVVKNDVIPQYGLKGKMSLQASSTAAMLSALKGAIKDKRPIVVTLWKPHVAYTLYKLKDLTDPKGAMGSAEKIYVVGHKGFSEKFPKAAAQLKNFTMDDKTLGSLEAAIHKAGDGNAFDATKTWMKDNQDFVNKLKATT